MKEIPYIQKLQLFYKEMAEFLNTFLSLLSPSGTLGAIIYKPNSSKVQHPFNIHSVLVVLTWVVELVLLWFAYWFSSLLYEKTLQTSDDSMVQLNMIFFLLRASFVTIIVMINLFSSISMDTASIVQTVFCGGKYFNENATSGYSGGALKWIYFVLELVLNMLPLLGIVLINSRLGEYDLKCSDGSLEWGTLKTTDQTFGQFYAWTIMFYGMSLFVRTVRNLAFGLAYGATNNNYISYPTFQVDSLLKVREKMMQVEQNMKMEKDIRTNARYEVTYNLDSQQYNHGVSAPYRKDLTL